MAKRLSFDRACRTFVNRFTCEHVPAWALQPIPPSNGVTLFYAPQFASDREWYDNCVFFGDPGAPSFVTRDHCYSTGQTWPCGEWLAEPYRIGQRVVNRKG